MEICATSLPRFHKGEIELLPQAQLASVAGIIKALSDPIRLQMVYVLTQLDDVCTCEFEELLGLAQSKVSYHLKILLEAGIVSREEYRTWSHYRLANATVIEQVQALTGITLTVPA